MPCKTICVGNITVGGAGKTQLVIWLCKNLSKDNKVLVISKGYRGNFDKCVLVENHHGVNMIGDEAKELSAYAQVIVTKKIRFVLNLVEQIKPDIIIFDDWMQNPELYADDTFLVIDQHRKFGNGLLIPAGPLREYPNKAKFDSIVIIGNMDKKIDPKDLGLNLRLENKPVVYGSIVSISKHNKKKKYFAFAGIGNFDRFIESLKAYGLDICESMEFADHHNYTDEDIKFLNSVNGMQLITTKKDFVKLEGKMHVEVFVVELKI